VYIGAFCVRVACVLLACCCSYDGLACAVECGVACAVAWVCFCVGVVCEAEGKWSTRTYCEQSIRKFIWTAKFVTDHKN
jgi:hypothetical protein